MTHSTPLNTASEQWIQHPQGRLFARRWNSPETSVGAPIVLMHDSLGCVELWRDFPEALRSATGRDVIAYDRLGFGRSDAREGLPPNDFISEEAAQVFPLVCDHFGIDRFVVLGHSVGGGMAVHCAAFMPARCEALVTLSAQAFSEDITLDGVRQARGYFRKPEQLERLARYHGDKARWVLDAWTERWLHPDFADWSLRDVLPRVQCPTLAIHGANDEYGSPRHPEMIGELTGGAAQVHVMAGVGHMPHREASTQVLELVCGFLR